MDYLVGEQTMHVRDLFSLKDEVAVVTGGAGLLGSEICRALAEAGAHVVVADIMEDGARRLAAELSQTFSEAEGIKLDVADQTSIESMFRQTLQKFHKIDILVNCAAISIPASVEEMTLEEWDRTIRVTLTGVFLCSQAAGREMVKAKHGKIVNIASMYGSVVPDQRVYGDAGNNNPINYGAAKAGVIHLTRYLAAYWAKDGIRVNCVSPGGIFNKRASETNPKHNGFAQRLSARIPLGRMGDKSEMNGAVLFLASEASAYITGYDLVVDGGLTAW